MSFFLSLAGISCWKKQWCHRWFETPLRSRDVTVFKISYHIRCLAHFTQKRRKFNLTNAEYFRQNIGTHFSTFIVPFLHICPLLLVYVFEILFQQTQELVKFEQWHHVCHYIDVIMTTMASQITSLTIVYSTVYSDADQRKHQSSASLAFVWGIHRDRWIPAQRASYAENVSIWWRHHAHVTSPWYRVAGARFITLRIIIRQTFNTV